MTSRSPIPVVVMEEHHEAFFAWMVAIRRGWMAPSGNFLLHVDEHADIGTPRLRQPLPALDSSFDQTLKFTFQELSCFEFIIPSIALGIFDQLLWLRQGVDVPSDQHIGVKVDELSRRFDVGVAPLLFGQPLKGSPLPGGAPVRYRHQSLAAGLPDLKQHAHVVLDIDLDYFSCEDAVNLVQRVEVTQAEYEDFQSNRYHFLRIGQGSRIRMQEEDGHFYIYLRDYDQAAPTPLRVTERQIVERIGDFVDELQRKAIQPCLIDIARSRMSGYTPHDQWAFIEDELLRQLGRLYDLQHHSSDSLQSELGLSLTDLGAP